MPSLFSGWSAGRIAGMIQKERSPLPGFPKFSIEFSPKEFFFFEGRLDGVIADEYKGDYGFGFDPIFIPDGHKGKDTLAMIPSWKAKFSHRAIAFNRLLNFLTKNY